MFNDIAECIIPEKSVLHPQNSRYSPEYHYTDSFYCDFSSDGSENISFENYIYSFYTSSVFKLERFILRLFLRKSITDQMAGELAKGERQSYAAWNEEFRDGDQLLMADFMGSTKSWFMLERGANGSRLYFGTVVMSKKDRQGRVKPPMPFFQWTVPAHKFYSKALLWSAKRRLAYLGL